MRPNLADFVLRCSSTHRPIVSSSFNSSQIPKSDPLEKLFSPIIAELQATYPILHEKEELLIKISWPLQPESHYNDF